MFMKGIVSIITTCVSLAFASLQNPNQPRVAPGPSEPDWIAILDAMYGLRMFDDLENPVRTNPLAVPGLFRKAGPGPVRYLPMIALGLETRNRGGWYHSVADVGRLTKIETWNYQAKNTGRDIERGENLPPALARGSVVDFDPGDGPFGLWVANDGLKDGGVFTEPCAVAALNRRLAKQPYKAMIYRNRDKATGKVIANSYLIGWEYSTNDDFQDVVCRVDNVELIAAQ
jgi:hypothetical protein